MSIVQGTRWTDLVTHGVDSRGQYSSSALGTHWHWHWCKCTLLNSHSLRPCHYSCTVLVLGLQHRLLEYPSVAEGSRSDVTLRHLLPLQRREAGLGDARMCSAWPRAARRAAQSIHCRRRRHRHLRHSPSYALHMEDVGSLSLRFKGPNTNDWEKSAIFKGPGKVSLRKTRCMYS